MSQAPAREFFDTSLRSMGKSAPISTHVLRNLFDKYDKDGNGSLDRDELHALLSHLGSNLRLEDLDKDKDNRLTFEEISVLCDTMGRHTHPIFKAALNQLAPESHNAMTTIAEAGGAQENPAFLRMAAKSWRMLSTTREYTEKGIADAFRKIDVDNDGYLAPMEIRRAIKEIAPALSEVDITLMLATADRDSDGYVTFTEFKQMMAYNKEDDLPYWERYGKRDMMVGLADRSKQVKHA